MKIAQSKFSWNLMVNRNSICLTKKQRNFQTKSLSFVASQSTHAKLLLVKRNPPLSVFFGSVFFSFPVILDCEIHVKNLHFVHRLVLLKSHMCVNIANEER